MKDVCVSFKEQYQMDMLVVENVYVVILNSKMIDKLLSRFFAGWQRNTWKKILQNASSSISAL